MSKHPRLWAEPREHIAFWDNRPGKENYGARYAYVRPVHDKCVEYLSLSEAQEMADRAREEAFREMARYCAKEAEDLACGVFQDLEGGQHWARMSGVCRARAESSKPSPQGGGEKYPPRVRIKIRQLDDYYKRSTYGAEVVAESHVDPIWSQELEWPQYLSVAEHNATVDALRGALAEWKADFAALKNDRDELRAQVEELKERLAIENMRGRG